MHSQMIIGNNTILVRLKRIHWKLPGCSNNSSFSCRVKLKDLLPLKKKIGSNSFEKKEISISKLQNF